MICVVGVDEIKSTLLRSEEGDIVFIYVVIQIFPNIKRCKMHKLAMVLKIDINICRSICLPELGIVRDAMEAATDLCNSA